MSALTWIGIAFAVVAVSATVGYYFGYKNGEESVIELHED